MVRMHSTPPHLTRIHPSFKDLRFIILQYYKVLSLKKKCMWSPTLSKKRGLFELRFGPVDIEISFRPIKFAVTVKTREKSREKYTIKNVSSVKKGK